MVVGVQVLIISSASGRVLTVPDDVDGSKIQQQSSRTRNFGKAGSAAAPEQSWELVPVGHPTTSVFKIVSVASGKLLDVRHASTEDHAEILQYHDNGGSNQHWRLEVMDTLVDTEDPTATHFAFTIISEHSGKVLDVPLDKVEEDGANIQQYTF